MKMIVTIIAIVMTIETLAGKCSHPPGLTGLFLHASMIAVANAK